MKPIVKYSKRKTLAIQILDGQVIVRAPFGVPDALIDAFLAQKQAWIAQKLAQYQPLGYVKGQTLRLFGDDYQVVTRVASYFKVVIAQPEKTVFLYHKASHSDAYIQAHLDAHLKTLLDVQLRTMLARYTTMLKIAMPPYIIRKYKRLYGRCSRSGALAFNLYLYHETLEFIEYVVVHELAHLYEFNHSPAFYKVVATMMPDYKGVLARKKTANL